MQRTKAAQPTQYTAGHYVGNSFAHTFLAHHMLHVTTGLNFSLTWIFSTGILYTGVPGFVTDCLYGAFGASCMLGNVLESYV